MMSIRKNLAILAFGAAFLAPLASAQEVAGSVTGLTGPQGAVFVLRNGETRALLDGDLLFPGDEIVTRTNGTVTITLDGCTKTLANANSIIVSDAFCEISPTTLASTDVIGGITIGAGGTGGGIGATPILLGLAGAGGLAAAAGGGGSNTPVSP